MRPPGSRRHGQPCEPVNARAVCKPGTKCPDTDREIASNMFESVKTRACCFRHESYDNGAETVWFSPVDIAVFYSHSIERFNQEVPDISSVSILSYLIGDELRGCFESCRRTVGQSVKSEIQCWLLGFRSILVVLALMRLPNYAILYHSTSDGYNFEVGLSDILGYNFYLITTIISRLFEISIVILF